MDTEPKSPLVQELARCRRKLTTLRRRGLSEQDPEYRYWAGRLEECLEAVYQEFLAGLEEKHGPVTVEKKLIASGALQVTAYTLAGRYIQHVSQDIIPPQVLAQIPLTQDYRSFNPPCAVCGAIGTELHHWAPRHLFPDAEQWPTSYLCKQHHDQWHRAILEHWAGAKAKVA